VAQDEEHLKRFSLISTAPPIKLGVDWFLHSILRAEDKWQK